MRIVRLIGALIGDFLYPYNCPFLEGFDILNLVPHKRSWKPFGPSIENQRQQ